MLLDRLGLPVAVAGGYQQIIKAAVARYNELRKVDFRPLCVIIGFWQLYRGRRPAAPGPAAGLGARACDQVHRLK